MPSPRAADRPEDWWALAWLRGTELATDVLWSRSPALSRGGARQGLWLAGVANLAMTAGLRLARYPPLEEPPGLLQSVNPTACASFSRSTCPAAILDWAAM